MKNAPVLYRDIITFKNEFLQRLEIKLNAILKKNLDGSILLTTATCNWIETLFSKQKKTDFKPKDEVLGNPEPTHVNS